MTDFDYGMSGLRLVAYAAVLIAVYRYIYYPAARANWQQNLFVLRDGLWLRMNELGALDNPGHLSLRDRVNSILRHTDELSLIALMLCPFPPSSLEDEDCVDNEINNAPPDIANTLRQANQDLSVLVFAWLFIHTFPGVVLGLPALCLLWIWRKGQGILEKIARVTKPVFRYETYGINEAPFWTRGIIRKAEIQSVAAVHAEDMTLTVSH